MVSANSYKVGTSKKVHIIYILSYNRKKWNMIDCTYLFGGKIH